MIVVRLIGGLGNQMFQYAAARALADRLGTELLLDVRGFESYSLRRFGLEQMQVRTRRATAGELAPFPEWQRKLVRRLHKWLPLPRRYYVEPFFGYNPAWADLEGDLHLDGYFQSEQYFPGMRAQLRAEFTPRAELSAPNQAWARLARSSESVMLHVRRGDYVSVSQNTQIYGACSVDYYRNAIATMRERTPDPRFFVFSDDIAWARENLPLGADAVFVEGNHEAPEMDIFLMAQCRYHIIANSSFSWWGAWLADTDTPHVIVPSPWFDTQVLSAADLLPPSWQPLRK